MRKRSGFFAYWPSQIKVFFLLLILVASGILLVAADFGESSASLGQITDEFDTPDNVSVSVNVNRNATLNAMELNGSAPSRVIYNLTSLREHDYFGAVGNVAITFTIVGNDEIRAVSTVASQGAGYMFLTVDRAWLNDKYIRFRYYPQSTAVNVAYQTQTLDVWDGDYDRSNATDFPVVDWPASQRPPFKGGGSLFHYQNVDGLNGWFTKDFQINTTGGSLSNCTVFFWFNDGWGGTGIGLYLDWIEINTGAGGTGNLITINYNDSSPITMEVAGGQGDYGFALNPELPFSGGGYEHEGYFTTTDYLTGINGSVLVQLTNTTIPAGTGITAEFSVDNSTWVNPTTLTAGFMSIDLRDQNWTAAHYVRYNFTGGEVDTPRLYQSRLITTQGVVGPGAPGQNVSSEWVTHNLTSIDVLIGTHDSGDVNSTLDIDGDTFNCSEIVGAPGYRIGFNWTGVDDAADCLWVVSYVFYDGNQAHDIHIELWNFTSLAWVEIGTINDGVDFSWENVTVYGLRIPNDFVNSTGAVLGRFDHVAAGNINHDIHVEYLKLLMEIPAGPAVGAGAVTVNVFESDAPWIAIAIILMCVAYLLFRSR